MYGIVVVEGTPDYPQDAEGNQMTFPLMTISSDRKYHNGLYWDPQVLKTGKQVLFTLDFFDKTGVNKLHYVTYDLSLFKMEK